ncbi:hypothetical protein [Pseudemcibacter aquimaris]|uniref:hypothetical protein n=1 Tax=Pseudemcibacter aquimaris TaxID=2857064 RepID=UPI0020137A5B|nr:hypothetical protein [Pseudemcibacter aquimaris]MCC3860573.1 hypothetical protein [Pseudemcibacter aquimaris]WDU59396.1 hypothetical protein KW060_03855 [Pseudemcibacter aquimaris]
MNSIILSYALIGTCLSVISIFTLWRSWSLKSRSVKLNLLGWFLLLAATIMWGYAAGGDRGTYMAMLLIGVIALLFVFKEAINNSSKKKPPHQKQVTENDPFICKKGALIVLKNFLFYGLFCGIVALTFTMGIYEIIIFSGAHMSNSLVFALMLYPIIWGTLAFYHIAATSRKYKNIVMALITGFGAILMVLGN